MVNIQEIGRRIRSLRLANNLGQIEFAERVGVASGSVSKLENGRMSPSADLLAAVAEVLDCTPRFLEAPVSTGPPSRPWLRAYADAPKRVVDRQLADCGLAMAVVTILELERVPNTIPVFEGDLPDDAAIEQFALEVRAAAKIAEDQVVGNVIRAIERLGCFVLPMPHELGRHLGLSTRIDLRPIVCVSRLSANAVDLVPGDRQRLTVAHELGHLALHADLGPPQTAEDARQVERQAFQFAGAFLAPGDAILDELSALGGRVTLRTLAAIKARWGISIKALVVRFRSLGVIDAEQARSLYKQISARKWNKSEPVPVGNEEAVWLSAAIRKTYGPREDAYESAANHAGIGRAYLERWTNWIPARPPSDEAGVAILPERSSGEAVEGNAATVTRLPVRR